MSKRLLAFVLAAGLLLFLWIARGLGTREERRTASAPSSTSPTLTEPAPAAKVPEESILPRATQPELDQPSGAAARNEATPAPGGVLLAGRIVDESSSPVAGVGIWAISHPPDSYGHAEGIAREDGTFRLDGLAPGEAELSVFGRGFERLSKDLGLLEEGQRVEGIEIVVRPNRRVIAEGIVRRSDGTPVNEAFVVIGDEEAHAFGFSDAAGRFRIQGVPLGSVTVSAQGESLVCEEDVSVQVIAGGTQEVELVLVAATETSVRILDEGGEPVQAEVEILYPDGSRHTIAARASNVHAFMLLRPGTYTLRATRAGKTAEATVELKGEPEREIVLRFE